MFETCQYVTNDEKVTIGLKHRTYKRQSHGQRSQEMECMNGKMHVLKGGYYFGNLKP
jgi:hypothetical protein